MKIFIDNGHGRFTPGKRSPNGEFREWFFNREIATRVTSGLKAQGYDAELLVPESDDIPLKERVSRVNTWCLLHGKHNAILISIHANAAGNGTQWMKAQGWSCYTTKGKTGSDQLATCLYAEAEKKLPRPQDTQRPVRRRPRLGRKLLPPPEDQLLRRTHRIILLRQHRRPPLPRIHRRQSSHRPDPHRRHHIISERSPYLFARITFRQ